MGKKTKVGKSRKDEYYKRAKDLGYRSRAAFKLLEINRRFQFLQKSRVCIDLCAAPGGWCQVAAQNMPIQSLIVGIDLVPIKPIKNVTTLTEDITTERCRQMLRKELQTWKADVVLHDGAPNVGKNWKHDAFQQSQLTLHALKLACEFLQKGGMFVTKVFRSADYEKLMWVFRQLFRRATATKPKSSRNESAEIFVVCEKFLAPDKLDPRFFDIKFVFKDVEGKVSGGTDLSHPEKRNKKAEGYEENNYTLTKILKASEYIQSDNHLDLLANCTQIVMDDELIRSHKETTAEVLACCEDIKVLGKRDLRLLQSWRKKIKTYLSSLKEKTSETGEAAADEKTNNKKADESSEEEEEEQVEKQLQEIYDIQKKDLKKKRKREMKEKRKIRDKMGLKMILPGDQIQQNDDMELFNLSNIKSGKALKTAQSEEMSDDSGPSDDDDAEVDEQPTKKRKLTTSYSRDSKRQYDDDDDDEDEDDDDDDNNSDDEVDTIKGDSARDEEEEEGNPLIVDLQTKESKVGMKTDLWFSKDVFSEVKDGGQAKRQTTNDAAEYDSSELEWESDDDNEDDDDDDDADSDDDDANDSSEDVQKLAKRNGSDSTVITSATNGTHQLNSDDSLSDDDDDDDDDEDFEDATHRRVRNDAERDGFEIVRAETKPQGPVVKLTPAELALGEELTTSSKRRREIIEESFNRYTHGEENLPGWFAQDEARHSHKQLPVTKEQIQAYKDKQKAINVNPIKKVAEAVARKKRRMTKRVEKARKKAEVVSDAVDVSDREKMKQIKEIYKKAGLLKAQKKEIEYVVAKRGVGKRVRRPPGIKGPFKVVDPRMKKDNRAHKQTLKKNGKPRKGAKVNKGRKKGR